MLKKIANINKIDSGALLIQEVNKLLDQQGIHKTAKFTLYMDADTAIIKVD